MVDEDSDPPPNSYLAIYINPHTGESYGELLNLRYEEVEQFVKNQRYILYRNGDDEEKRAEVFLLDIQTLGSKVKEGNLIDCLIT